MEPPKKTPGRKPLLNPAERKKPYSVSLSLFQVENLEQQAVSAGETPSAYVIRKLKLNAKTKPNS